MLPGQIRENGGTVVEEKQDKRGHKTDAECGW